VHIGGGVDSCKSGGGGGYESGDGDKLGGGNGGEDGACVSDDALARHCEDVTLNLMKIEHFLYS